MTHLYGLVKGSVDMDIAFSDEYMEGSVRGLDRKIMRKLKRGEFPVKDFIDLHGLTRQEAEIRVRDFLIRNGVDGSRLSTVGMGGTKPVVERADRENWWKNRRVEFILIK